MRATALIAALALSSVVAADTILEEGFEGSWLPSGWEQYNQGGVSDYDWEQYDQYVQYGTYCAHHGYDYNVNCMDWLVTPQLDLTGSIAASITFQQKQGASEYYEYTGVWVSTGSGDPDDGDFVELAQVQMESGEDEYTWYERSYDLDGFLGEQVYIAFYFDDQGSSGTRWDIDEVLVATEMSLNESTWGSIKAVY